MFLYKIYIYKFINQCEKRHNEYFMKIYVYEIVFVCENVRQKILACHTEKAFSCEVVL